MVRLAAVGGGGAGSTETREKYILSHGFNSSVSILNVGGSLDLGQLHTYSVSMKLTDLLSLPPSTPSPLITMKEASLNTSPWVVALDSTGHLIINLSKHAYERFGLEGHPTDKTRDRYSLQLNLHNFRDAESKLYKRVVACLERLSKAAVDFIISFACEEHALAFGKSFSGMTRIDVPVIQETINGIAIPSFPKDLAIGRDTETHDIMELEQWAGLVLNGCTDILTQATVDPFLSTCTFDQSTITTNSSVHITKIRGTVHPARILEISKSMNGASLMGILVHGNADAPSTWNGYCNRTDERWDSGHGYTMLTDGETGDSIFYQYSTRTLSKHPI